MYNMGIKLHVIYVHTYTCLFILTIAHQLKIMLPPNVKHANIFHILSEELIR